MKPNHHRPSVLGFLLWLEEIRRSMERTSMITLIFVEILILLSSKGWL